VNEKLRHLRLYPALVTLRRSPGEGQEDLGDGIHALRQPCPLSLELHGVSVAGPLGAVLVHPEVVRAVEVGVVAIERLYGVLGGGRGGGRRGRGRCIGDTPHHVNDGVKRTFTDAV